jgi:superfamily I DNA/RNA helicase
VEGIRNLLPHDKRPKIFELYRNYRLLKTIARVVQYVGVDLDGYDESTYKSIETSIPRLIRYGSFEEQIKSLAGIIKRGNLSDVGVLVPHNENVKQVSDLLNKFSVIHEMKYEDRKNWKNRVDNLNFTTTNPKLMTHHSAKGLQFETVFIPGITELTYKPERRISEQKALYVAMILTYRDLYVMYM